jgi:hypothetical protein
MPDEKFPKDALFIEAWGLRAGAIGRFAVGVLGGTIVLYLGGRAAGFW